MGFWKKLFGLEPKVSDRELRKNSSEPWADLQFTNDKLVVVDYNSAFVTKLRTQFGDLINEDTSDQDVVKLYVDRENLEHEEPRLEVLHMGIEEDGQLKIKLDWNKAFIDHLKRNGITGESEDEAIKAYLSRLTTETADEQGELPDVLSRDQINEAFKDLDNELQKEYDSAEAEIKKPRRRRRKIA